MKKIILLPLILLLCFSGFSQVSDPGIITGNVMDERKKALESATVLLIPLKDSNNKRTTQTDKEGLFTFSNISFGYYRLRISYAGMQNLTLDSINFRQERFDFNLNDISLKSKASEQLDEVIIYVEKPLIESKDGNITFNAGESALSAGSNASDLLNSVPLVSKDATGKITVRGKEPKILIDDKPVELNLQQLQDLLESLPGSSIEKIEVMTNPPPQYANEQGGVINIVTKKGKVGRSGRLNLSAGSRGEASMNGNFSYRKQGFSLSVNAGIGYNRLKGDGNSLRNNFYTDSSNFFKTTSNYLNKNWRPNFRLNMDYDFDKTRSVNFVLQYNQNDYHNQSSTEYTNINRFGDIYRLSERNILSEGDNYSPSANLTYTKKGKLPGESFKIITGANLSINKSDRDFFQQFFNPDHSPNGIDSTQEQLTDNKSNGYNVRVNYDRPLSNKKTFFSVGTYYNRSNSHIITDASYLKKPEGIFVGSDPLSNDFRFHQTILNFRASVKQVLKENFSVTGGISAEETFIAFELYKDSRQIKNSYWTLLPFANINRTWKDKLNLTLAYRRSIRRPGINELNPTIDFGDPYNVRFGNEKLEASTAHNFDLVIGRTKQQYYINFGLGYNIVENIFSQVRTLIPGEKTQITWENISGRKEYEVSTWGGLTITKKLKTNLSASYTFNEYSVFDKTVNRYRNGGSFTSNLNSTYTPKDVLNFTGSFTFNRFANPQGYARWNWSMNVGIQRKFFDKKLILTFNIIDPFVQKNRNYTQGPNFILENFNTNKTRNFRLSVGYNFTKAAKKKVIKK
ncbi:MAG TPA: outer membrane beta-barrel protein [Chitinophagaceae bacterium]|nr:outer membrane beta-barrel protein [Chitinophagaceae bacterium]